MKPQERFKTLSWEGPQMPPEYTPTPGFTLKGKKVGALCEEMFDKLSAYSTTDYWKSPIFQKNAWASWSRTLPKDLQSLKMSDFSQEMADRKKIQEAKKEAKAARSKDEKEFEKIQRDQLKQKYGFATVDGKRVPIGGYMVEAPNFIIGRGSANFTGCWKSRVQPSEITVNIVGDPQKKKELEAKGFKVVSKSDVMWLMTYRMRLVNSDYQPIKKVNFGAGSEFVHENEEHKYDKSEVLMRSWDSMKAKIFDSITSDDIRVSQAGTCAYLMMVTGQRIGGDGQKSGAGTVGMSTIQVRHVKVSGNQVSFNFLAKDSVPYKNTIEVEDYVADHLREFLKGKGPTDKVFDRTSGADVNAMMKDVVPDVSPKTFRTANAALELLQYLRAHPVDPTWSDSKKKQVLVLGNAIVAKKLNHQKNVSKSQGDQEARAKERIDKAKETLELRKNKGEEQLLKIKQQLKTAKELWTGDKLKAKISDLKEKEERIAELIRKSEERVETSTAQLQIKRGTAELALGTSLSSYVSPKIIYSWCKDVGLPPSKVYSKSLEQKQMWAEDTPPEYWREG